jgi:hypothetical protein
MAAPIGNKFALGLETSGRPPIYPDNQKGFNIVKEKCIEYFEQCNENQEKATITGLALFLGFNSRGTLNDYAKKEVFSDVIKRAMLTVENSYEKSGTTFDMFALKNMGWKDKTEVEQTLKDITPPSITFSDSASDDVE